MNNESSLGNGGAIIITPSARPSIHDHCDCLFDKMVSYGLTNKGTSARQKSSEITTSSSNPGEDEVDNVMSKLAYTKEHKRLSVSSDYTQQQDHDFEDSNIVSAKCLPPYYLPPHSPYRNKYHSWSVPEDSSNVSTESARKAYDYFCSNKSGSNENSFESAHELNVSETVTQTKKNSPQIFSMSLLGVLSIVAACYYGDLLTAVKGTNNPNHNNYDQPKFYNDLNALGKQYEISDDSILQVQSGIAIIFRNQDAGSFIFMYNSNGNEFNQMEFNNFMNNIANTAAKYLRNDSSTVQHIVLDTSQLDMETHSELMQKYRDDVTRMGVMLVKELDMIPSSLAMAFHYYCDEYNPLVKKSAIFFTLDMAKCSTSSEKQSVHDRIEKCLKKKWSGVPEDKINPLLTRVVSTVVDITSN